ncbi:MaoC family dehydratase [Amycolatopsis anabasis]|uniref:MaoC family dehydratase n=1 Tax=Amycolatopsis anabasis TaxID=1840409 RepID=UPI00131D9D3B|nr:MaoC family dehydratase [Amycolatopsis anabasis]
MRVFASVDEFAGTVGEHLGYTEWRTVTQDQVNLFADATEDHQWIHVDLERAARGPFGAPIAHGYLTLSLIPVLSKELYRVENVSMGINYGLNKVRFPQPVKVGSKIRGGAEVAEVTDVPGGKQVVARWTIEIDGEAKPACVAETVARYVS